MMSAVGPDATRHAVRFFEEAAYPADQIASYLNQGLESGVFAIIVATREHLDAIVCALDDLGVRIADAIDAGQLVTCDADELAAALLDAGTSSRAIFDDSVANQVRNGLSGRP